MHCCDCPDHGRNFVRLCNEYCLSVVAGLLRSLTPTFPGFVYHAHTQDSGWHRMVIGSHPWPMPSRVLQTPHAASIEVLPSALKEFDEDKSDKDPHHALMVALTVTLVLVIHRSYRGGPVGVQPAPLIEGKKLTTFSNANFPVDAEGRTYHLGTLVRLSVLPMTPRSSRSCCCCSSRPQLTLLRHTTHFDYSAADLTLPVCSLA